MANIRDERTEVIEALSALQKSHDAMVEKYSIDTSARLAELVDIVRGKTSESSWSHQISRAMAKEMLEQINDVRLKPDKGRGKDLYRIEKLLSVLETIHRKI